MTAAPAGGPSLAQAAWLKEAPLARLLAVLNRDGEEARVVGGAVRNALIGAPIREIDLATTALPAEVIARAEAAGFKAVPTGIEHGTVTVIVDGTPFEVTTLREDVETFGRHAKVAFGRDWRRATPSGATSPSTPCRSRPTAPSTTTSAALPTLQARRVRFIGEAATRIAEDFLRILRFFRFHATYGEGLPDPAGLHAAIARAPALPSCRASGCGWS